MRYLPVHFEIGLTYLHVSILFGGNPLAPEHFRNIFNEHVFLYLVSDLLDFGALHGPPDVCAISFLILFNIPAYYLLFSVPALMGFRVNRGVLSAGFYLVRARKPGGSVHDVLNSNN